MSLIKHVVVEASGSFTDIVLTWQTFITIVNRLPGVTVISSTKHEFPGGGFSGLILLAESHAAIHTWPEHEYAWCELATCGDPAAVDEFKFQIATTWRLYAGRQTA